MTATWHIAAAGRLWAKVDRRGPDDCWPFTGSLNEYGYGAVRVGGRRGRLVKAHRLAWMLANDVHDLTPVDHICHHCDNPPCCNPAHLYRGDYASNITDKIVRGRQPRGERMSSYVKAAAPRGDAWWTPERVDQFTRRTFT